MSNLPELAIDARHIDVWLASYQDFVGEPLQSDMRALLSEGERRQEARFFFADDRQRYLVTRALVRRVLSRYAGGAPAGHVFAANAYGRPEIANPGALALDLSFNISHTRGLIALGVSRRRALGVDVENVAARPASPGVAAWFFARSEAAALVASGAGRRPALTAARAPAYPSRGTPDAGPESGRADA